MSGLWADFVVERSGYILELSLDAAPGETVALRWEYSVSVSWILVVSPSICFHI